MAQYWTYDPTKIATSPLYQVRRLIGDVIASDQQLGDTEIAFNLTQYPSVYAAAAECCRQIAAQYARKVDVITSGTGGSLKTNYSAQSRAYLDLASRLENGRVFTVPYAGGISVSDKQAAEGDTDRVAPQFNIGMDDNQVLGGPLPNESADQSDAEAGA